MNKAWWLLMAFLPLASHAEQSTSTGKLNWYRGNTHAPSLNSDGNVPADEVARWYRENGYQFVVITEHEYITDVAPLNALFGAKERFLVMSGQEVTQMLVDDAHPPVGLRHAHVNAIGLNSVVMPIGSDRGLRIARGVTMSQSYLRNMGAIRAAGVIPQVWDAVLSQGKTAWGVAADDSHDCTISPVHGQGPPGSWYVPPSSPPKHCWMPSSQEIFMLPPASHSRTTPPTEPE